MADTPKLTDAEATSVRAWLLPRLGHDDFCDLLDRGIICSWSALGASGVPSADVTDLGRAALEAYDAEQRRRIRVEAMRKCLAIVKMERSVAEQFLDAEDFRAFCAMDSIRGSIRALIAKEEA